jgi:hypothetical protein
MKIAHLILTHKNPAQLQKLIEAMDHPDMDFFIHVDKKTDIGPFLLLQKRPRVSFIKNRVKIYWAGYGTIQATINGFHEILPGNYDYVNVISGQDFPLKTPDELLQHLQYNRGTEFITCETVGGEWPEAKVRMTDYHLINWRIPGKHRLEMLANKFLPKRAFPFAFTIVGRANWFTITASAARYILDFLEKNRNVVRFFKYSWGADEIIFSTILYNSGFKEKIQPNLVYVDWRGQTDGHPKILGVEDLHEMKASGKFFARKFDADRDSVVLDALEQNLQKKQASLAGLRS